MTLVNRSARPLVIAGRCPSGYLEAQVLKASGEVVYPPIFAEGEGPLLQCKVGGQTALRPGGEMRGSAFVILESGHVRAAATLIVGGMDTDVTSRVVVVKTTPGVQPDVVLRTSGDTGANPGKISPAAGSTSLPGGVAVPG
jgi:hypothetical protein